MHRRGWNLFAIAVTALLASAAPARDRVHLLRDIFPGDRGSLNELAGTVNGVFLFFATDDTHGRELWRSDGTIAGTQLVRDIRPGAESSIAFGGWAIAGGRLAFAASDGTGGSQLWSSDGTADGTILVRDTHPGDAAAVAGLVTPDGNRVWFTVQTNFFDQTRPGVEDLWISDLTAAGTTRVASVGYWEPGSSGGPAAVTSLTPFRGGVLVARKDVSGCCQSVRLTQVDQTSPEGALLYQRDLARHLPYMLPLEPIVAGETAYLGIDALHGPDECAFLRLGGGENTTLAAGAGVCSLPTLGVFGNDALVVHGQLSLQRATPAEDVLIPVAELGEAFFLSRGVAATPAGVYFRIRRDDGDELWRAQNAVDPPQLLHRFARSGGGYVQSVTAAGDGVLLFVTDNFGRDPRIWRSDGPSTSTRPIAVLPDDTGAIWLAQHGQAVLLVVADVEHGHELWAIPQAATCAGDCNASGAVAIDEVIRAVGIVLGNAPAEDCAAADADADQLVSVDELVAAVVSALDGCSTDAPAR